MTGRTTGFILDGIAEIGANVRSMLFLFDLFKAFDWTKSSDEKDMFSFIRAEHILSYHLM